MTVRWYRSDHKGRCEPISPGFVPLDAMRHLMLARTAGFTEYPHAIEGWRYWVYITRDSPLTRLHFKLPSLNRVP